MKVYLVEIAVIIAAGLWADADGREKARTIFIWFSFLLLSTVAGIRGYHVGSDTKFYVGLYRRMAYLTSFKGMRYEKGFLWFEKIVRIVSGSAEPRHLLIAASVICVGTFCFFTWCYSKDALMSILTYITLQEYFNMMNIMRQALALSFVCLGLMVMIGRDDERSRRAILRKVIPPFLIGFATLFHSSAAIGFIPYAMIIRADNSYRKETTAKEEAFKITVIAVLAFALHSVLLKVMFLVSPDYMSYMDSDWGEANFFGSLLNTAIPLLFLWVGAFIMKQDKLTRREKIGILLLGLDIIFYTLSMRMKVWNRLAGYFNIYTCVLWIPEFTAHIKNHEDRWIVKAVIFFFTFLAMVVILHFRPEWTKVVPYTTSF